MASDIIAAAILGAILFLPWFIVIRLLRRPVPRRDGWRRRRASAVSGQRVVSADRRPRLVWPV